MFISLTGFEEEGGTISKIKKEENKGDDIFFDCLFLKLIYHLKTLKKIKYVQCYEEAFNG